MLNTGSITIRPLKATLSHDTDLILKMDPFCIFILGEKKVKTQTCKGGSKNPHWKDQLTISRATEDVLLIEIWDEVQLSKNKLIAVGQFPVSKAIQSGLHKDPIMLYYKKKPAGYLHAEISFQPDNQSNSLHASTDVNGKVILKPNEENSGNQVQYPGQDKPVQPEIINTNTPTNTPGQGGLSIDTKDPSIPNEKESYEIIDVPNNNDNSNSNVNEKTIYDANIYPSLDENENSMNCSHFHLPDVEVSQHSYPELGDLQYFNIEKYQPEEFKSEPSNSNNQVLEKPTETKIQPVGNDILPVDINDNINNPTEENTIPDKKLGLDDIQMTESTVFIPNQNKKADNEVRQIEQPNIIPSTESAKNQQPIIERKEEQKSQPQDQQQQQQLQPQPYIQNNQNQVQIQPQFQPVVQPQLDRTSHFPDNYQFGQSGQNTQTTQNVNYNQNQYQYQQQQQMQPINQIGSQTVNYIQQEPKVIQQQQQQWNTQVNQNTNYIQSEIVSFNNNVNQQINPNINNNYNHQVSYNNNNQMIYPPSGNPQSFTNQNHGVQTEVVTFNPQGKVERVYPLTTQTGNTTQYHDHFPNQ